MNDMHDNFLMVGCIYLLIGGMYWICRCEDIKVNRKKKIKLDLIMMYITPLQYLMIVFLYVNLNRFCKWCETLTEEIK